MGSILAMLTMKDKDMVYVNQFSVPMPPIMHVLVSEQDIGNRRVLVIGDVHGCYDELLDLLQKVDALPENTLLVSCGDLLNRGPKSIETIRFIQSLGKDAMSVRGNHEERVIKEWQIRNNVFYDEAAIASAKFDWVSSLNESDIQFLIRLPYTITLPLLNTTVVHAGLDPWKSLTQQQPFNMTLMRNIIEHETEGYVIQEGNEEGVPWATCWMGPNHVYFGHDAQRRLQKLRFATGIDTGCVYGGLLTGVLLEIKTEKITRTIVSVAAKKKYKDKSIIANSNNSCNFYF